jgi:ubiquinone/menaquinone biosynthesis C-methylase UbiE
MLAAVQALQLPAGATVLDVASGPGEPALTIAKALPQLSARRVARASAPAPAPVR